jgi:hypothetical protein
MDVAREWQGSDPYDSFHAKEVVAISGVGVIWDGIPFETPVIPGKAGIQSVDSAFPKVCRVDSRFPGNDCGLQRPCLANDTSNPFRAAQVFRFGIGFTRPRPRRRQVGPGCPCGVY